MWTKLANAILKYRIFFLLLILGITAFLAFSARDIQMSYDFSAAVPRDDEELLYLKDFKKMFGEDANVLAIGLKSKEAYKLENFKELKNFTDKVKKLKGVSDVFALPQIQYLKKDTTKRRFVARPIFRKIPEKQKTLDSLITFVQSLEFYDRVLFNQKKGATAIFVSIEKKVLNSKNRAGLIKQILKEGDKFTKSTKVKLHYAGVPFIRSIVTDHMGKELQVLLLLSGVATAIILFIFFRTLVGVIFPIIVISIVVVWCIGFLGLFGYKITILTGLLPPILVVIGIPNCVYLINKYHQEFRKHSDKAKALHQIIKKIGVVALMTNTTTAIGFAVFIFMDIRNLVQFGVVASLSIMSTFLVSIILLPIFLSYLPSPTPKELKHLDRTPLNRLLSFFYVAVFKRRLLVYGVVLVIFILSLIGIYNMRTLSFMLDNLPQDSEPQKDLVFFEENFGGMMPLEVVVNTNRKKGVMSLSTLKQVEKFEKSLEDVDVLARPLSLNNFLKASRQAFYNNSSEYYGLPSNRERVFLLKYLQSGQDSSSSQLLNSMVDSTGQYMRISLKIADVGSRKLDSIVKNVIEPRLADSFKSKKIETKVTGTTKIFLKGNEYLIRSLKNSLLLAIGIIAILMAVLFRSFRMIFISILTNILPLMITAGLMGFLDIPLKPANALIFSIAFGIAIDDSIHFLARYRQELAAHNYAVPEAIKVTLKETGTSMVYTSIILFFGFIVFVYSDFTGTVALGALTSTTLLCAMFANLILLPALLLNFDRRKPRVRKTSSE